MGKTFNITKEYKDSFENVKTQMINSFKEGFAKNNMDINSEYCQETLKHIEDLRIEDFLNARLGEAVANTSDPKKAILN